jgi:hypothetical protein
MAWSAVCSDPDEGTIGTDIGDAYLRVRPVEYRLMVNKRQFAVDVREHETVTQVAS